VLLVNVVVATLVRVLIPNSRQRRLIATIVS